MLEIPNKSNLPYYVIAVLVSICGGLITNTIQQGAQCEKERNKERAAHAIEIKQIRDEARNDAKEASQQLTKYLFFNDSINRANMREIQKLRKR